MKSPLKLALQNPKKMQRACKCISICLILLLSSCGYQFIDRQDPIAFVVPYVIGDIEGKFTDELIFALSNTTPFQITRSTGRYHIQVRIDHDVVEKIGYRYDRNDLTGDRDQNLIPTEGRRVIEAQVQVIDSLVDEIVLGPYTVCGEAEFDYVDPNSICDLSFITPKCCRESVMNFSLGQLDSVDSAEDNVLRPLFRNLSQAIVDSLLVRYDLLTNTEYEKY